MYVKTIDGAEVMVASVGDNAEFDELNRYKSTGYTPEGIVKLENAYWLCNMQIALYDDELRKLKGELATS